MSLRIISKSNQAYGAFNNGQIVENKPIGFPQDGGFVRPYSNLFYWAKAQALIDSTIGLHPHQGFEIMSFVLRGSIKHYDTKMKDWKDLNEGDVQIIRSGNGISHAETMLKDSIMFQIWLDPNLSFTLNKEASYSDYSSSEFPVEENDDIKKTTFIGQNGPIELDTPGVQISRLEIKSKDYLFPANKDSILSMYVLEGNALLNGQSIEQDDFIIAEDEESLMLEGNISLFMISSLKSLDYPTYNEIVS